MKNFKANNLVHKNGETTHYYEGGSRDGIPMIFVHSQPDIAETQYHQLNYFASTNKYRVIAPDMRGYSNSTAPKTKRSYSPEVLVPEIVELAAHLRIEKAVWIAHNQSSGVCNALAAHHPELFLAMATLSVPYRSIELGVEHLKTLINREIYPEDGYGWGQWDYMKYYERNADQSIADFETHVERITPILYLKGDLSKYHERAITSGIQRDGGWFGGHPEKLPKVPIESTGLEEKNLANLLKSHKKHGFFPSTAYYLNSDVNTEYAKSAKNRGVLEPPVLFIDAKLDVILRLVNNQASLI